MSARSARRPLRRHSHQRQHPVKCQTVGMPRNFRQLQCHGCQFQVHTLCHLSDFSHCSYLKAVETSFCSSTLSSLATSHWSLFFTASPARPPLPPCSPPAPATPASVAPRSP